MEMKFGEFDILCTEQTRWTWEIGGNLGIGKKEVAVFSLFLSLNKYVLGDEYRPYFSVWWEGLGEERHREERKSVQSNLFGRRLSIFFERAQEDKTFTWNDMINVL